MVGDLIPIGKEKLTLAEYNALADVPPELEWLANITNRKTRRFYKADVAEFTGINGEVVGLCVHSLRATAATNALSHEADIAKVQEWLGHANVSTTRPYGRRKTRPEDSPMFHVKY
jgi:integrase